MTTPPLLSQTVNLWKDTSVATVIGAAELMYQAARVDQLQCLGNLANVTQRGVEGQCSAGAAGCLGKVGAIQILHH